MLASLQHPNIAGIHGLEEAQGRMFLIMELAEGVDLSQRIAQGPIPEEEALLDLSHSGQQTQLRLLLPFSKGLGACPAVTDVTSINWHGNSTAVAGAYG